jgi:hypothetical protein
MLYGQEAEKHMNTLLPDWQKQYIEPTPVIASI